MPRQVISLYRVLPPFEVVSYTKTIEVVTKTPGGDELVVTVPVTLFSNEDEYIADTKEAINKIMDGMVLEKAAKVRLVTPEQLEQIKTGAAKIEDLDRIEEPPLDAFDDKMQRKTIDMVD